MARPASGDVCVYVVGMHRSGTSATTGMLGRLGLAMPAESDLVPADGSNERGHWESRSLVRCNNRILRHFGGTVFAPPHLEPGWAAAAELDGLRAEAAARFAATFPARPLAWKDPRTCVTLPFWRTVVEPPAAAVLVLRDPVEVARSLQRRSGLLLVHGLALWQRSVRAAAADLDGMATLACDYRHVAEDPVGWASELVEFLAAVGVAVGAGPDEAARFVDRGLRHERPDDGGVDGLAAAARDVYEALRTRQGAHHPWAAPDLGPEPPWVDEVLTLTRRHEELGIAHASLRSSRVVRVAARLAPGRYGPGAARGGEPSTASGPTSGRAPRP